MRTPSLKNSLERVQPRSLPAPTRARSGEHLRRARGEARIRDHDPAHLARAADLTWVNNPRSNSRTASDGCSSGGYRPPVRSAALARCPRSSCRMRASPRARRKCSPERARRSRQGPRLVFSRPLPTSSSSSGVRNYVGAAWEVNDVGAELFARIFDETVLDGESFGRRYGADARRCGATGIPTARCGPRTSITATRQARQACAPTAPTKVNQQDE